MRILLSNDDGFDAEGLIVLEEVLVQAGHQVSVCAPMHQRSASSHSITMFQDVALEAYGPDHYKCSGTPADCLFYGFGCNVLQPSDYDLVVSGINAGYNLSSNILYSGTCGVASEAAIWGLKAIALSCYNDGSGVYPYKETAQFLLSHLDEFLSVCNRWTMVNINAPSKFTTKWSVGGIGSVVYRNDYNKVEGKDIYRISPGGDFEIKEEERYRDLDLEIVKRNEIAVSAVKILPRLSQSGQVKLEKMAKGQ